MLEVTALQVLDANIEHADRLGAFNGAELCSYHYSGAEYPPNTCCGFGLVDINNELGPGLNCSVDELRRLNIVTFSDRDFPYIKFAQFLHDIIVVRRGQSSDTANRVRDAFAEEHRNGFRKGIPLAIVERFANLDEIDKPTYVDIMRQLRDAYRALPQQ
ncbi:MAG TPA: hypothetical protein VN495_02525 [Candidatus Paceibacterota bacterium]|nr:hypothetical protein [Candidatus Paceibacterota bacterium]